MVLKKYINKDSMKEILDKINEYIDIKEKNDIIVLSSNKCRNLEEAVDLFKKSSDKKKTISLFSNEIREEIIKLIDGGILEGVQ